MENIPRQRKSPDSGMMTTVWLGLVGALNYKYHRQHKDSSRSKDVAPVASGLKRKFTAFPPHESGLLRSRRGAGASGRLSDARDQFHLVQEATLFGRHRPPVHRYALKA